MNNRKKQVWLPLLFSITMIAGMFFGYKMRDNMPGKSFFYTEKRRPVQEIMDLIQNRYVDDVKMDDLTDTAIQAMLYKLDPHSVFIPAEKLDGINEELAGSFYGIGIEFNIFNDTINVVNVTKDGPSFKAGIQTGDKFIAVNDSVVAGKKINDDRIHKLLRGDKGTPVSITILRGKEQVKISVTRDAITVNSVDASYMIADSVGYIKLRLFSQQTYHDFMEALMGLKKQGLKKLILDLRGNGGGVLDEAVDIADEFLSGDKLITYTEGKHVDKKEYRCRRQGQYEEGALVVLADEGTASASEVLIGALQDWDRATIIGRRSFGKGLVQEQFDLSDHSALRLTIARYYTPIGRSIQRPYSNGRKAYYDEVSNRFHDGETQSADSMHNDTTKVYKTPGGKIVYGGGGITPDYFIPADTTGYSFTTARLYTKGTTPGFVYHYYLDNQQALKAFKNPADFIKRFTFTDANWEALIAAATKDSVSVNKVNEKEKTAIVDQVKALLAQQLWQREGLVEVLNTDDNAIKKALEILK
ncbi:MAG: S41 family peptidase [Bacteroidetes bacterium]|nr:S41 family peptidase [Bacteroidota bacterium]